MESLYQTESFCWLRAFLWRMSQTSRDRVNSSRVRTHENNSGDAVRRLGTIIQSIFFEPNQEPAFFWPFGYGPVRVGTQGFFRLCLKTFVAPFLPNRLTAHPQNQLKIKAIASIHWTIPVNAGIRVWKRYTAISKKVVGNKCARDNPER